MTSRVGVLRSAEGLRAAIDGLGSLAEAPADAVDQDAWETTNLHLVSTLLATAALLREETRGSHWREDFPERDDATGRVTSTGCSSPVADHGAFHPSRPTDPTSVPQ